MALEIRFVLTCEHADFRIPPELKKTVDLPKEVLRSHRGWDRGAYEAAKVMRDYLRKFHPVELFHFPFTRLLIDANRTLENDKALSKAARKLAAEERSRLTSSYTGYRRRVEKHVAAKPKRAKVIVLSVHSFTPVMKGRERATDIGLLFRKKIGKELRFAEAVRAGLKKTTGRTVHFNRPYRGHTDCFLNDLCDRHLNDENVVGLFIEFNQKYLTTKAAIRKEASMLAEAALTASREF